MNADEREAIGRGIYADGLAVSCWCDTEVVIVARDLVARGWTGTCGAPDCKEPAT